MTFAARVADMAAPHCVIRRIECRRDFGNKSCVTGAIHQQPKRDLYSLEIMAAIGAAPRHGQTL